MAGREGGAVAAAPLSGLLPTEFVLWDTEFTAWEGSWQRGWSEDWEHREIISIAAIRVKWATDAATGLPALLPLARISMFTKPHANPTLSEYITNLTGVTQADVDGGTDFISALEEFGSFCAAEEAGAPHLPQYGWGGDEPVEECVALHEGAGMTQFLWLQQVDTAPVFKQLLPDLDLAEYSSGTIHKAVGIPATGQTHEATWDCESQRLTLEHLARAVHGTGNVLGGSQTSKQ
jgi:inhibitor of KinA sporulation pathway (predicted exonuclease)